MTWTGADAVTFTRMVVEEAATPHEKRPLFRPLPPAPAFPLDALGPLAPAALAIQQSTQAPLAIAAQSVLAVATLAAQAQRDVILPGGGRRPLSGLFVSVADSGERKSSVDRLALAPVYEVEQELRQQSDGERAAYLNQKTAWDAAREHAKRTHKGNMDALRSALDKIGAEPKPPLDPMMLISDPTPEGLTLHLANGRPTVGVFTAEGGLLLGGAAFNEESRMRTAGLFNVLWDGDPLRRRRVGTGSTFLPGRRCSAHIMFQPVVGERLFGDPLLDGMGLTARMLIVAPQSTAGTRLFREPPSTAQAALTAYNERVRYLLTRPPQTRREMPDALDPPGMGLSVDATTAWVEFHDLCEREMSAAGHLASIKAFASKLAEHAGRLAATLTLYNDPEALEVPLAAMRCGIILAMHFASEMLRLHGGAAVSQELRAAERLLAWWRDQPSQSLNLATIYQSGPNSLRDAKSARRAVEILEEHGHVERLPAGTIIDGAPRREAWTLRP